MKFIYICLIAVFMFPPHPKTTVKGLLFGNLFNYSDYDFSYNETTNETTNVTNNNDEKSLPPVSHAFPKSHSFVFQIVGD